MVYLDNASTTKPYKEVADVIYEINTEKFGNASSLHILGRTGKKIIDDARKVLATEINAKPSEVIFTSGGTESINTALFSVINKLGKRGKHIISTEIEHTATKNLLKELANRGFEVEFVKPTKEGSIDVETFKNAVREDTILASFMLVNNEIGSIFPVNELVKAFKEKSKIGLIHIDAIQALGKMPVDAKIIDCDLMSFSAHKLGGPKGTGALYVKEGTNLNPVIFGGGQEFGLRSGTENIAGIAGFAKALEIYKNEYDPLHIEKLYNHLDKLLVQYFADDEFRYNGKSDIKSIVNFSIPTIKSEVALRVLESHEVYVSAGSACSKGKVSYVLSALGVERKYAEGALRVSFSMENKTTDIDQLVRALVYVVDMMK